MDMLRGSEAIVAQTTRRAGTPEGPVRLSGWTCTLWEAEEAAETSRLTKTE